MPIRKIILIIIVATFAARGVTAQDKATQPKDLGEETPIGRAADTGPSGASVAAAPADSAAQTPLVSTWDFVRMLLVLAAVVGAIYVILRLLKRGSRRLSGDDGLIRVIGSRALSGGRSLHLVQVGTNLFLIGSSEGGVSLVSQIADKESVDSILLAAGEQEGPRKGFAELLADFFSSRKGGGGPADAAGSINFVRRQKERLRRL